MNRLLPILIFVPVALHAAVDPVSAPQGGMEKRHAAKVAAARAHTYGMLMIGDSITHNFEKKEYAPVWEKYFAKRDALNLGYSGARTENILWNLTHGELDNQKPKIITLLIGTNDVDDANYAVVHTPERVFEGTKRIIGLLREKCPDAKIVLLRVFPRADVYRNKAGAERGSSAKRAEACRRAGELTRALDDGKHVFWLDIGDVFLGRDGAPDRKLMPDLLHPSPAGAAVWAGRMEPLIAKLSGETPAK